MQKRPLVYISYPSENTAQATELYREIQAAGFRAWTAAADVGPGMDWAALAKDAIARCDFVLALLSRATTDRTGYFVDEWRQALDAQAKKPRDSVFLIPVRLEDAQVPQPLRHLLCVDLHRPGGWERLLEALLGPAVVPPPLPPKGLMDACRRSNCVLFVGQDFSRPAGCPSWAELVDGILQRAVEWKHLDPVRGSTYRAALQSGQVDLVADSVARAVATADPTGDQLAEHLRRLLWAKDMHPTRAHHLLARIGFSAAITIGFDPVIDSVLGVDPSRVYTLQAGHTSVAGLSKEDPEAAATEGRPKGLAIRSDLASREFFVLRLSGAIDRPGTILLSTAQYHDAIRADRTYADFVEKLCYSRSLFFAGVPLEALLATLDAIGYRPSHRRHYALVGVSGAEWRAAADQLETRYNVEVLPYADIQPGQLPPDAVRFLEALMPDHPAAFSIGAVSALPAVVPRLLRVVLENIGPFDTLDLALDPNWNVLLGDNGVGKSSILRAIALALCGRDAEEYAGRLIKVGQPSGQIVLETAGGTNTVELFRTPTGVEVKAQADRPMIGTERWLAVAFPPLRHVGWSQIRGPSKLDAGAPYTVPGDALPLLDGGPDPRSDNLKQTIINLDYMAGSGQDPISRRLLDDMFEVIGTAATGVTLKYGGVDPHTWQIIVLTDDGEIPLEAVSQGMQSLMGWLSVLLQRLHEVYAASERPRSEAGLVLMDEIDAHMHPSWQRSIVGTLSSLFPAVQFIATSHSPLVVGSMPAAQVLRAQRTKGDRARVVVGPIGESLQGMRADQILTSDAFDLVSSRDPATEAALMTYTDLVVRDPKDLSAEEEGKLREAASQLKVRQPNPAERKEARAASEMIASVFSQRLAGMSADERQKLLCEVECQVQEIITGSRRPQ